MLYIAGYILTLADFIEEGITKEWISSFAESLVTVGLEFGP